MYKRQLLKRFPKDLGAFFLKPLQLRSDIFPNGIGVQAGDKERDQVNSKPVGRLGTAWSGDIALVTCLIPVSYTHLDVYKRQP